MATTNPFIGENSFFIYSAFIIKVAKLSPFFKVMFSKIKEFNTWFGLNVIGAVGNTTLYNIGSHC